MPYLILVLLHLKYLINVCNIVVTNDHDTSMPRWFAPECGFKFKFQPGQLRDANALVGRLHQTQTLKFLVWIVKCYISGHLFWPVIYAIYLMDLC